MSASRAHAPRRLAGLALVALLPTILLFPFRHAAFVSDDFDAVLRPPPSSVAELVLVERGHSPGDPARYRPLVRASYLANRTWSGRDPAGYHLTNTALHGVNAALLGALVTTMTGTTVGGLAAGALFAIHPATHENVVWISGRTWPTAALFVLIALLAATDARPPLRALGWASLLVASALAFASYEASVSLPGLVALAVFVTAGGPLSHRSRHALRIALPVAALVGAYLVFRAFVLGSSEAHAMGAPWPIVRFNLRGLTTRALACGGCMTGASPLASTAFLTTASLAAVSTVLAWTAGRTPAATTAASPLGGWWFGLGAFAMAFVPFVTFPGYTDRFAYLALAGLCAALGSGIGAVTSVASAKIRLVLAVVVLMLVAGVGALWVRQYRLEARDWVEAGEIATAIREQAVRRLPDPAEGAPIRFYRVPMNHGVAVVYITFFTEAMRDAWGRPGLDVRFERGTTDKEILDAVLAGTGGEAVFAWDDGTRTLHLLRRPE